jgi:hypothetical protein
MISFLLSSTPSDTSTWLTWISENPGRGQLSKTFDVLAMPFLVGTAAAYIALGRRRSPRLAWVSGIAWGAGLVGLAMVQGWEVLAFNLVVDDAASPETVAKAIDDITSSTAGLTVMLLFLLVGLCGFMGTLASLWRSGAVPRAAVLLLFAGFLTDLAGRPVEGHLLLFLGATWIAVTLLDADPMRARHGARA